MTQTQSAAAAPTRRAFAASGLAAAAVGRFAPAHAMTLDPHMDDRREWEQFKRRFLDPSGRVVDIGNGGCSHTEGQGWGMLFAVSFDDPEAFDLIHGWTARHLRRGTDSLHSWRYQPNAPVPVGDPNNATDGDICIAAALWRAARRWGRPDQARAATAIGRDILAALVTRAGPRTVLLPGLSGFTDRESVTVNPSYYAFPFLADLAEAAPSPVWADLIADGRAMLAEGRFGRWQLPPDWLRVSRLDGTLRPHPHWPARFSWDAIRIPLWLSWGSPLNAASPAAQAFLAYWRAGRTAPPAWVDLLTNEMAEYQAPAGMAAVACLVSRRCQAGPAVAAPFPSVQRAADYYSSALILLSRLASRETGVT